MTCSDTGVLGSVAVNSAAMHAALTPSMLATDIAYHLTRKGVPFRTAHHAAGVCVGAAARAGVGVEMLEEGQWRKAHPLLGVEVRSVLGYERSVEQYGAVGGTARTAVLQQIAELRGWLA